jgi:hypothetical protein
MIRKEVVVGNKVFDLGIEEFEESVANKKGQWPTLELEVGPMVFSVGYLQQEKAVFLTWWGMTSVVNIVWTRFVFLRLAWPFWKRISAFTYATAGV